MIKMHRDNIAGFHLFVYKYVNPVNDTSIIVNFLSFNKNGNRVYCFNYFNRKILMSPEFVFTTKEHDIMPIMYAEPFILYIDLESDIKYIIHD